MTLSAAQCRAARGLLAWSQTDLGGKSKVAAKTITDFERGLRSPHPRTLEALVKVFEDEGVVFLEATDSVVDGVGLRTGSTAAQT